MQAGDATAERLSGGIATRYAVDTQQRGPFALTTIHLVRHGQASAGTHDYDRLSATGRQQARILGNWWKRRQFTMDAAYSGTLQRQRDTARLALEAAGLDPTDAEHAALNEYDDDAVDAVFGNGPENPSRWDTFTFSDYVAIMERWRDADDKAIADGRARGGHERLERWDDFATRGWRSVREAHGNHDNPETLVFFTSGGVVSTLVSQVLGLDFAHTLDAIWRIRNASVTTLDFDGEHGRLVDFNTIGHLEAEHDSALITLI